MKTIFSVFLLIVITLSFACCQHTIPSSKLSGIVGQETYETIYSADRLIYCVVRVSGGIEGTEEFTECMSVPENVAKEILEHVTNDQNYLFNVAKTNIFYPQAALIFKSHQKQIAVQINTSSAQFRVIAGGKEKILDYTPMKKQFNETLQTIKR